MFYSLQTFQDKALIMGQISEEKNEEADPPGLVRIMAQVHYRCLLRGGWGG